MSFSVTSYNILADAYITPDRYPHTPSSVLEPENRRSALLSKVEYLLSDLICLQEVEPDTLRDLVLRLEPLGYEGHYLRKSGGKPDGCATFFKRSTFALGGISKHYYRDGGATGSDSGHVGLVLRLEKDGRNLAVANTHLKWDPRGTVVADQVGYRQITELLDQLGKMDLESRAWIICGDFNVTPDSDVVQLLLDHDLDYAHRGRTSVNTCNANNRAKLIDYMFYSAVFVPQPLDPPRIRDDTPLPSKEEPSDHLALQARFNWC